jgi:hypothetical protein
MNVFAMLLPMLLAPLGAVGPSPVPPRAPFDAGRMQHELVRVQLSLLEAEAEATRTADDAERGAAFHAAGGLIAGIRAQLEPEEAVLYPFVDALASDGDRQPVFTASLRVEREIAWRWSDRLLDEAVRADDPERFIRDVNRYVGLLTANLEAEDRLFPPLVRKVIRPAPANPPETPIPLGRPSA